MKESIKNKKIRVLKIITELYQEFPNPKCELNHTNPLELLVATILSAQCTDKRVNIVTPNLFAKYNNNQSYASADQSELEEIIKSTGFYKNKAKNIIASNKLLLSKYNGEIPKEIKELTKLPGVGRKTANVVLGNSFNIACGIVVDTHVKRITKLLNLTQNIDPDKIEKDLVKLIEKDEWINFSHLLILHGRKTCIARRPKCSECSLNKLCPSAIAI